MTSQPVVRTVIEGEASESDEDDTPKPDDNVLVTGEAPESEDEDDQVKNSLSSSLPPLKVDPNGQGDGQSNYSSQGEEILSSSKSEDLQPKYDTLLHKKLRERNASFQRNLTEYIQQKYVVAARNIREICKGLSKSQTAIQDVSHNMRLLTNDLFHLEDKIDIVVSGGNILPEINLPNISVNEQSS